METVKDCVLYKYTHEKQMIEHRDIRAQNW